MSMTAGRERRILIAGAGVAGLSAALAFARHGFPVHVFERAPALEETGAGLQLSPNATRILDRLGVLEPLKRDAVRPEVIVLKRAASLRAITTVPLGARAEKRWGAPYLVAHRADVQRALLDCVAAEPAITLTTGAVVRDATFGEQGASITIDRQGATEDVAGALLVGADGVWSRLRGLVEGAGENRFTGHVAWRATLAAEEAGTALHDVVAADCVTAFLHPRFHLVAYPVRGGKAINLVAVTRGGPIAEGWSSSAEALPLPAALRGAARPLSALAQAAGPWTAWPIHEVTRGGAWTRAGAMALIGDAAHAMTPHAAQGAAMAVEDAWVLAAEVAAAPGDPAGALARFQQARRPRVLRVATRGRFNRFVWHAGGPIALGRDFVLAARSGESLMRDFDWLYGWEASEARQ